MKQFNQLVSIILAILGFPLILTGSSYSLTLKDISFDVSLGTITEYINTEEKDIIIPSSFIVDGIKRDVKGIGKSAFYSKSLIKVVIPSSVDSIGEGAFANNSLTEITIPSGVTYIGVNSFGRNFLEKIIILNGVNYIGSGAFTDNLLTEVTLPSSVTYIGMYAFAINSLMDIVIPFSVIYIGEGAFYGNLIGAFALPIHLNLSDYGWVDNCGNSYFAGDRVSRMNTSYSIPGAYAISYKLDGGENSSHNPNAYLTDEGVALFEEATKDGYTFEAWYSDKALTNRIDAIAAGETSNITLWVKWEISTLNAVDEKVNINVYPNPTVDELYVDFEYGANRIVCIYDGLGNLVHKEKCWSSIETIDMSTYSKGLYVLKIKGDDGIIEFKIFKE